MKKSMFALGISAMMLMPMFMACETVEQKEEKVKTAQAELDKANQDAADKLRKEKEEAEWVAFRKTTEAQIQANSDRIADMRVKKSSSGKVMSAVYAAKIDALQTQNSELRTRLDAYANERSDWAKFKREFERDMAALGKAFEDLGTDSGKK
jgi:chromosome segregation ATPase